MNIYLLTLFRSLLSFLEEFILIDNFYFNVILTEAEGKDRKEGETVLQVHWQLLVNTGKLLRNDLDACWCLLWKPCMNCNTQLLFYSSF